MSINDKKASENKSQEIDNNHKEEQVKTSKQENKEEIKEKNLEEKLKDSEEKHLRSLAEIENQRRRFEKDIKDAFEFGSFNFAKENLAILDNLQRKQLEMMKNLKRIKT